MRVRLTMTVKYEDGTMMPNEAKETLGGLVNFAAGEGLLSTPGGIVEEWSHKVTVLDAGRTDCAP